MAVSERIRALSAEIAEVQAEVRILDEQIAFQSDVAEDARIRALVSETPLADRDARVASEDLARLVRTHADLRDRIESLRAEQDRLLEALLEEKRPR